MKQRTFLGVFLIACLLPHPLSAAGWKEKAEAEGRVVLYASMNTSDTKALTDGFKQLYPKIDAQFYRTGDSQLMEKVMTEARAGKPLWDVICTTGFYGYFLKKRGMLEAYDSPERKYFRDAYKDAQAAWTSIYTTYAVFGYNTRLVPQTSIPKFYADLLKPEWKGQIGMEGRAYEWFATTMRNMGGEGGQDVLRSLKRIPDRIDTPPDPPRLIEGIRPAVTSAAIYEDFDRYVRLFNETFKLR